MRTARRDVSRSRPCDVCYHSWMNPSRHSVHHTVLKNARARGKPGPGSYRISSRLPLKGSGKRMAPYFLGSGFDLLSSGSFASRLAQTITCTAFFGAGRNMPRVFVSSDGTMLPRVVRSFAIACVSKQQSKNWLLDFMLPLKIF